MQDTGMLRDNSFIKSMPSIHSLDSSQDIEARKVLDFIDSKIAGFPSYFLETGDSDKENRITDFLIHYLECCKDTDMPFRFAKNPTQPISTRETDIGVFPRQKNLTRPITVLEFEAKRLSSASNYNQYVCGVRGGIERFKRGLHGGHLNICGMFGYVQAYSSEHWIKKINELIERLGHEKVDSTIDWTSQEEKLQIVTNSNSVVAKQKSINDRKGVSKIVLCHYFLDLKH